MLFEKMKEIAETIGLLEKDLMRDLSEKEVELVATKGWRHFLFNHIGMSEEEYSTLKKTRELLSQYLTGTDESYHAALKKCDENVYFLLRDLASDIEQMDRKKQVVPEKKVIKKPSLEEEFDKFLKHLYTTLKPMDSIWFNKVTPEIKSALFEVYKKSQSLPEDELCCLITDEAKDAIILDLVSQLKDHKTVSMTNDEFMEVADYLSEHEDRVYLVNNNGKVTLK